MVGSHDGKNKDFSNTGLNNGNYIHIIKGFLITWSHNGKNKDLSFAESTDGNSILIIRNFSLS